jgi:hypothetical protein
LPVTAELERCLDGQSQVMVPEAGHGIHADNAPFYNEAVLGFLQELNATRLSSERIGKHCALIRTRRVQTTVRPV